MAALTITVANVVATSTATTRTLNAGGTITQGQAVYIAADGDVEVARANAATTDAVAGIALNAALAGQTCTFATGGLINPGATVLVGVWYYLSDAVAGSIVPVGDLGTGDYVTRLYYGTTTSQVSVDLKTTGVVLA